MKKCKYKKVKKQCDEIPTIVVNSPSQKNNMPYMDEETEFTSNKYLNIEKVNNTFEENYEENNLNQLPILERRNSISLPNLKDFTNKEDNESYIDQINKGPYSSRYCSKMVMCWAHGCKHYNARETCKFFRFPLNRKEYKRWMKLLRREDKPGTGARVCSCHFKDGKRENGPEIFKHNVPKLFQPHHQSPEKKKRTRMGLKSLRDNSHNARRKSVLSPNMFTTHGDEELGNNSPANSITSVNSLASLLREKIQNLPQSLRKKRNTEYKTKIFVLLLFIAIIILIVTAYFLYSQKILAKAYFEKIKFNKLSRHIRIYNNEGAEILFAKLGTTIKYDKVLPCLKANQINDGSICLEWMHRARLYLQYYEIEDDVKCYNLKWTSLSEDMTLTDCFDLTNSHWYGGGQTTEFAWPLDRGSHHFHPFITGKVEQNEWGNVLKRYFISSRGVALVIDKNTPLYVSIQNSKRKELCLRAQYDDFAFVRKENDILQLNYTICTGSNMSKLHGQLSEHSLWDGLKKEDGNIIDSLLTEPVWEITSDKEKLTEETIYNFTDDITNSVGVLKQGHVLINEFWQNQVGDFELDINRFPTLEKTMEMLKRRGFRVVFSIQPFISTESFNFAEVVKKELLVSERFTDRRIPALTRYKTLQSGGVLDITKNRTVRWLVEKLQKVMEKYKFDAYYLDMGTAFTMPYYYDCERALVNPDIFKTLFINSIQSAVPIFGISSAIERPKPPVFVVLPEFESSWKGLRKVIPTILTYGILGYPFLIPGAVGGDFDQFDELVLNNGTSKTLPDQELYIRWLQLATFLPVVRYHHLPSSYGEQNISDMAKSLAITRQNKVTPKLKKFARVSLNLGLSIIRPLWMLDSEDPQCHVVVDEFSIGDEMIVAPILYSGARQREIYLPGGVWKDGIDGSLRKGNRWIHDYRVEENEVAYFERMPDDTRF